MFAYILEGNEFIYFKATVTLNKKFVMHFNIFTYKNQSNNFKMSLKVSKSIKGV